MAYIRKKQKTPNSAAYYLVESYRDNGEVRQRTLCYLGCNEKCATLEGAISYNEKRVASCNINLIEAQIQAAKDWRAALKRDIEHNQSEIKRAEDDVDKVLTDIDKQKIIEGHLKAIARLKKDPKDFRKSYTEKLCGKAKASLEKAKDRLKLVRQASRA